MTNRQTILITGGAIGLGRELTRIYSNRGARVVICGRTWTALEEVQADHPGVVPICLDLADPAGRKKLVDTVHELECPLDLLIQNAAVQYPHDLVSGCTLPEKVETELAVNLLAPLELSIELLPLLRQAKRGHIAFVSSALARVPKKSAPVYCASKAGLSNFARGLRYQLEGTGIRVSEVVPDLIVTRMAVGRGDGALSACEAAQRIVVGLDRGQEEIRLGRVSRLYALHRVWPDMAYRILKAS